METDLEIMRELKKYIGNQIMMEMNIKLFIKEIVDIIM